MRSAFWGALVGVIHNYHLEKKTCKTPETAVPALKGQESAFGPQTLKTPNQKPSPSLASASNLGNQGAPSRSAAHAPRRHWLGVEAAWPERAQYQLVHGVALRRSAETRSVLAAVPRCREDPAAATAAAAAPCPRLLPGVRSVSRARRLFAAPAVAMATGNASLGPGPAPRAARRRFPGSGSRAIFTIASSEPAPVQGKPRASGLQRGPRCRFLTFH